MNKKTYLMDWLVDIGREDMASPLKTIIDSSCPISDKGRVVKLIVTMEYNENDRPRIKIPAPKA